jgi:fibro-slime domain-containing protein
MAARAVGMLYAGIAVLVLLHGCGDDVTDNVLAPSGSSSSGSGASSGEGGFDIGVGGGIGSGGAGGAATAACGDGKVAGDETCDDQNSDGGDGCSASCQVEAGWTCPVAGAACVAKECGDGIVAGSEACDDGNAMATDGCSDSCALETGFKCPTPNMPCEATTCGDGVPEGTEQCDDGNNDMGDGCTPFCVNEPDCSLGACTSSCGDGIKLPNSNEQCEDGNTAAGDGCSPTCEIEPGFVCNDVGSAPTELVLPIVLRDFTTAHADFEGPCCTTDYGIVESDLGVDGKPVYVGASPMTTNQTNFDQWYRDTATVNMTVLQSITLGAIGGGQYQFTSNAFFPLDGLGFGNTPGESRNFHFTSEVRYWFEYAPPQQLDFTGDDDVFVFVNKKLAVDLGGVHGAISGSVTLDAGTAGTYGLTQGNIYEIVVFQAERHTSQSNYTLTLSNFVNYTSDCQSVCGDGIKTPDEVCDDGVNDGSYGHCTPDCKFGPYCGDGNVDMPHEKCDDGNEANGDGCSAGCQGEIPA